MSDWVKIWLRQGRVYKHGDDRVVARVHARQPRGGIGSQPSSAFVESIRLWLSFAADNSVESLTFGTLQPIVESAQFSEFVVQCDDSEGTEYQTFKRILHSVLERKQLAWALKTRKLQFWGPRKGGRVTSADILSVPTEHADGDIIITLDTAQQAEWLLRFTPDAREEYLWDLAHKQTGSPAETNSGKA